MTVYTLEEQSDRALDDGLPATQWIIGVYATEELAETARRLAIEKTIDDANVRHHARCVFCNHIIGHDDGVWSTLDGDPICYKRDQGEHEPPEDYNEDDWTRDFHVRGHEVIGAAERDHDDRELLRDALAALERDNRDRAIACRRMLIGNNPNSHPSKFAAELAEALETQADQARHLRSEV